MPWRTPSGLKSTQCCQYRVDSCQIPSDTFWRVRIVAGKRVKLNPTVANILLIKRKPKWHLTHCGRDKMAAISQTAFSNAFTLTKIFECLSKLHLSLFLSVQLTIFQHWFRWWLGADQTTSHHLNQWWSVHWRIYSVSLGFNELTVYV